MIFLRAAIVALFAAVSFSLSAESSAETVVVRVGQLLDVEQGIYLADRALQGVIDAMRPSSIRIARSAR